MLLRLPDPDHPADHGGQGRQDHKVQATDWQQHRRGQAHIRVNRVTLSKQKGFILLFFPSSSGDNVANVTLLAPVDKAFSENKMEQFNLRDYVGKGLMLTNLPERTAQDILQVRNHWVKNKWLLYFYTE